MGDVIYWRELFGKDKKVDRWTCIHCEHQAFMIIRDKGEIHVYCQNCGIEVDALGMFVRDGYDV